VRLRHDKNIIANGDSASVHKGTSLIYKEIFAYLDIVPYSIAVGNPPRVIKKQFDEDRRAFIAVQMVA